MSCYVDSLQRWPTKLPCFRSGACHLIADTLEELHAMAKRIGLKRRWFQDVNVTTCPHYDLTAGRRIAAVAAGAVECDRRTFVTHMRRIRTKEG